MTVQSTAKLVDQAVQKLSAFREDHDGLMVVGFGWWELFDEHMHKKDEGTFVNLVTQVGDQYYGERASGVASPPGQVTGMRLGTGGATAVAKTGAGAVIVTYTTGSNAAVGTPTSALNASSRRIQWSGSWAAGVATATGINEWVITNESPLTNVAGTAANTISRAVDTSNPVNKAAGDTLAITWNHDLLGA